MRGFIRRLFSIRNKSIYMNNFIHTLYQTSKFSNFSTNYLVSNILNTNNIFEIDMNYKTSISKYYYKKLIDSIFIQKTNKFFIYNIYKPNLAYYNFMLKTNLSLPNLKIFKRIHHNYALSLNLEIDYLTLTNIQIGDKNYTPRY